MSDLSLSSLGGVAWARLPLPSLPIAKLLLAPDGYLFVATDYVSLYLEHLHGDAAVQSRLSSLNRTLDVPTPRLLALLHERLYEGANAFSSISLVGDVDVLGHGNGHRDQGHHQPNANVDADTGSASLPRRSIELTFPLAGGVSLSWRVDLTPVDPPLAMRWLSVHVTCPSLSLCVQLERRVAALRAEVAAKDRDIRDMHELIKRGGQRFRPRSKPFSAEVFDEEMARDCVRR